MPCYLFLLVLFAMPYESISQSKNEKSQWEDVKSPARLYFDEMVNNRNNKLVGKVFSFDYVFHEMNGDESMVRLLKDGVSLI